MGLPSETEDLTEPDAGSGEANLAQVANTLLSSVSNQVTTANDLGQAVLGTLRNLCDMAAISCRVLPLLQSSQRHAVFIGNVTGQS